MIFLEGIAGSKPDLEVISPIFINLSPEIQKTSRGKKFANLLKGQLLKEGAKAIAFEQAHTKGQIIKLSDFEDKYVLIDFWSS